MFSSQTPMNPALPSDPGSYALRLRLPAAASCVVGRLGLVIFPAGEYIYLGSARGPGGIRARLQHHFREVGKPHWHLDALRPFAEITGGWYAIDPGPLECEWSQALGVLPGVTVPVPGFGASDCKRGCPAHLLYAADGLDEKNVAAALEFVGGRAVIIHPFGCESS